MAERVQTYKNHLRWLPAFHFFVLPVLLLNVLNEVRRAWRNPSEGTLFIVVVATALLTLAFLSRSQAVTVQDRVIRLEMRLRLRQILPPELQTRVQDLTHRQLVALRFASDAELPVLVREILDGKLTTGKEIKLRVKNWQGDWLRA
ncbi:MAG TPA: DUF6526 family protein [Vicinamibacterales bacterium]|jgi:hypothetical protein|nr:DUF6526 family protein [Vicinamibacterales bacterium]